MEKPGHKNKILKEFIRPLPLDENFCPAAVWNQIFLEEVLKNKARLPLLIAIVKDNDNTLVYNTRVFPENSNSEQANFYYAEQIVKTLLWVYGGYKIIIGGSNKIGEHIKKLYSKNGKRSFDIEIMSRIYEKPFTVEITDIENMPEEREETINIDRNLDGCRIGFDLGASDRKVSAVINGKSVFSEEVVWDPGSQADPSYHYNEIIAMLRGAATHMPKVDAIGGSSAGIYINNRVMIASLFRSVPQDLFNTEVKNIFLKIQKELKVPLKVINDGEVTALAGSMSLNKNSVLGIAMGSSEAGGFVDQNGNLKPWINEVAFFPVDFNPDAAADEWSGDKGCGVQYFSQQSVIRLARKAGISFESGSKPAQNLIKVQELMKKNDKRAIKIFETIGGYLGYALVHYYDLYKMSTVLILGRVSSGKGGTIIIQEARKVLKREFPGLYDIIDIHLPDEKSRRIGQSIAAASLPSINI
ncbi:MAG: ROK family protein [Actinobacteria bacterium]|nr:ROK family protein [Actinomycetota bacterium]